MRPAVFLDRDGILTVEKGYISRLEDMEIFDYAAAGVEEIHKKGYLALVITNQSAVGRGILSLDELEKMNKKLIDITRVDGVYYCPHWDNGVVSCPCRKPGIKLLEIAKKEWNICMQASYFVGDRASDIEAGVNAGLCTVLAESGYGTKRMEKKVYPDFTCRDLMEFAKKILMHSEMSR